MVYFQASKYRMCCNKYVCKAIYSHTCALIRHKSRKRYAGVEELFRYFATNREVAGSIPDYVNRIFD